jgi:hypothetical protein
MVGVEVEVLSPLAEAEASTAPTSSTPDGKLSVGSLHARLMHLVR